MQHVKTAVVGAGVLGLSTAVRIAEALPHCSVTVIAEKFSPNTTSDGAAGILLPTEFPGEMNAADASNLHLHSFLGLCIFIF